MATPPAPWIQKVAGVLLALGILAGLVLIVSGLVAFGNSSAEGLRNIGWGLFAGVFSLGLFAAVRALITIAENSAARANETYPGMESSTDKLLHEQNDLIKALVEAAWLSDAAKSIAFRNKDREALRKAIHEDLEQMDFERAYYLVDEMERRFGYRQEAEAMRAEIDRSRQSIVDRKVDEAVGNLEKVLAAHDWTRAKQEYERLAKVFPSHPRIRSMPEQIEAARNNYKSRLIRDFQAAAGRNETEHAMDVLKELDKYLTPKEAEAYRDMARGVIKERQATLQVRFSMAQTSRDWNQALQTAAEIIEEFPHSKMAEEARDVLPKLRELAAASAAVPG